MPFLEFFESNESNILSTLTSRLRDRIRSRHWRRFSVKKTRFKIVPSTELPSTSIISTDEVKTKNLSPRFLDYEDSVNGINNPSLSFILPVFMEILENRALQQGWDQTLFQVTQNGQSLSIIDMTVTTSVNVYMFTKTIATQDTAKLYVCLKGLLEDKVLMGMMAVKKRQSTLSLQ